MRYSRRAMTTTKNFCSVQRQPNNGFGVWSLFGELVGWFETSETNSLLTKIHSNRMNEKEIVTGGSKIDRAQRSGGAGKKSVW